jgi:hypothetical protein
MLFHALTGSLPFAGTPAEIARAQRAQPAPEARALWSEAPPELNALCAALLERDPGARMTIDAALCALQLAPHVRSSRLAPAATPTFVGRARELDVLRRAFAEAQGGKTVAVLVEGRSGIGKTALVRRFAATLPPDALLLHARCHERESMPYKAFDTLIDELDQHLRGLSLTERSALAPPGADALLQIFPRLAQAIVPKASADAPRPRDRKELRETAFAALKELLRGLALRAPLVLIVDDLQWADLDSAHLLLELVGSPAPALLYVGCYREEEREHSDFVRELLVHVRADERGSTFWTLALGALEEGDAIALASSLLEQRGAGVENTAARLAREASGVPFVLAELAVHALRQSPAAHLSLAELLARRVESLAALERQALELLALAARPLPEELMRAALAEDGMGARALRGLEVEGLVQQDAQGRLVVYHDRLREHVASTIAEDESRARHRRLAEVYERHASAEPEWLVAHWRAAGEPERALEAAIGAAHVATQKLAFNRAGALYRTALELMPAGDARAPHLQERLAEALVNAGRGSEAAAAFVEAARHAPTAERRFAFECSAIQQYLRSGCGAQASELMMRAFARCGLRYPAGKLETFAVLLSSRARIALRSRHPPDARATAQLDVQRRVQLLGAVFRECAISDPLRALLFHAWFYEHALRAGDRENVFIALAWDVYHRAFLGRARMSPAMLARLARLDDLASELGTPYARATAKMMRGINAIFDGRYLEGARGTGEAMAAFRERCVGASWEESVCAVMHYAMLENVGPLTTFCQEAPRMLRRANERADQVSDALLGAHMANVLLVQDRPEEALSFLKQRLARLPADLDIQRLGMNWRVIDALFYMGAGAAAWHAVEASWPEYQRSHQDRLVFLRIFAQKRRAQAALLFTAERPDAQLRRIACNEATALGRTPRGDARAMAESIHAAIAFQDGDRSAACAHMARAVEHARELGAMITMWCYVRQLGRIRGDAEGEALLTRADAELRAQGVVRPERWVNVYAAGF